MMYVPSRPKEIVLAVNRTLRPGRSVDRVYHSVDGTSTLTPHGHPMVRELLTWRSGEPGPLRNISIN